MLVPYEYTYLVGALIFLFIWLNIYHRRKDLSKEMLFMSLFVAVVSTITAYYWWTIDWWHPLTITGTRVGIEDFILGFASGGIMAVIYEDVFKKKYYKRKLGQHYPSSWIVILLALFTASYLFWITGLTSFHASAVAMIVSALFMFFFRRDLISNGLISGILMVLISIPSYLVMTTLSPGWIEITYYFDKLSGILILGLPIEEFVFWFLIGLVCGPLYEYWQGKGLRKI